MPENPILKAIFSRRSIRKYTEEPVARECLELLVRAAMAAPTACNSQPWEFVVITEPEALNELRSRLRSGPYNAPAAIVVCANLRIANNSCAQHYRVQDCSAATENILIAAAGMGLGTVWIGVYPLPSVMGPVREAVGLPEAVIPLCVVYVGHPAEEKAPSNRSDPRRVYWQVYEPRKRRAKIKNAKYRDG